MRIKAGKISVIVVMLVFQFYSLSAQLSPGDLAGPHSRLEGISNCTLCHILGNKVSNDKCLGCHSEVKERITLRKGYHASSDVNGKQCIVCHSDHNGKNFQLVRLDTATFDHNLTGYPLSVPHARKECKDCHNSKYIVNQKIKTKKFTFIGLGTECLNCHADYHQKTLSSSCLDCHNPDSFKPATKFNHSDTRYPLLGKHKNVECVKCHAIETTGGTKFQKFKGIVFTSCTDCHKDPHNNKFGQNCSQCHSEESFKAVKVSKNFDHNKTDFKLVDKHLAVSCQACHKGKFTDPLKHDRCTDCHADYHKKQFVKGKVTPDCSQCHDVKGFKLFSYTIDQHKTAAFPLSGAHTAVPCTDCHRKQKDWNFRGIGLNCNDCHQDIHKTFIPEKYYPDENCKKCHTENRWNEVTFDHSVTAFKLTGAHSKADCMVCHFKPDSGGKTIQKFSGTSMNCSDCHEDKHFKQFARDGATNCAECHDTDNWKASRFDHNTTAFRLDGKHVNVPCAKCHKLQQEGSVTYVIYKIKEYKCESCHF